MCSDEHISRGTQINQTWIHHLILSRSLLDPLPLFHSCYYAVIGMYGGGGGQVDETCSLKEREEECVIWTWGGGNDHQQNENKWVVIPQEEIYPHLFLVMKSMNWPCGLCVFQSYCFLKTGTDHFKTKVARIYVICCYSMSVGDLHVMYEQNGVMVTKLIWRSLQATVIRCVKSLLCWSLIDDALQC